MRPGPSRYRQALILYARGLIRRALQDHSGSIPAAAADLGVGRTNLYRYARHVGLHLPTEARAARYVRALTPSPVTDD